MSALPANADDPSTGEADRIAEIVSKSQPNNGPSVRFPGVGQPAQAAGKAIQAPNGPNGAAMITNNATGATASITLPLNVGLLGPTAAKNGAVVYAPSDQQSGGVVVEAMSDGSLQIQVVLQDAEDTHDLVYELDVSTNAKVEVMENGAVLAYTADGGLEAGLAPPWAKDASGQDVKTYFTVDGTTVTQHVEATSSTAYPVTADPWFGINLFSSIWRDSYNGDYRYNGNVSWWGASVMWGNGGVGGYATGQWIMRTAGRSEWTAKYSAITNKATLKQQYDCHVLAGTIGLPFTGTYNLERFRADKSDWLNSVWSHRCNW